MSQVYTSSCRINILGDPTQLIMTPENGQTLHPNEQAKLNEMASGQSSFPIALALKNTPDSLLNKGKRHPWNIPSHIHLYFSQGVSTLTSPMGAGRDVITTECHSEYLATLWELNHEWQEVESSQFFCKSCTQLKSCNFSTQFLFFHCPLNK